MLTGLGIPGPRRHAPNFGNSPLDLLLSIRNTTAIDNHSQVSF
jgi:hypothetical protein